MFDFSVRFDAIDRVSSKINAINARMDKMGDKARSVSSKIQNKIGDLNLKAKFKLNTDGAMRKIRNVQQKLNRIGESGRNLAGQGIQSLFAGAGMLGTALQPLNVARKYELAFKDVKKAIDGTPEQLAILRKQIKAFQGASFEELAAITAESGKMGFNAENVMAFADSVVKGAKALDFNAEMAVGQVGKILSMTNQMNNAVEAGKDVMNKVVHLENNLAGVKGAGVIDIWKRNADLYSQLGLDNEQMGAMSAFLGQTSVSSELGASGFKIMINRFKALDSKFGFFQHIKANGLDGIKNVMAEISKMTPEEQIKAFGSQAMTLINKLQNAKNIEKLNFALEISKNSAGAVKKEWELFRATFDERMNDSKKKIANLMDTIGRPMQKMASDFLGFINPIIEKITDWVSKNQELVKGIMKFAAYIGGVLAILGVFKVIIGIIGMAIGSLATIGIIGLIGAIGFLISCLKDFILWIGGLFAEVFSFISNLNLLENTVYLIISAFAGLLFCFKSIGRFLGRLWDKFTNFIRRLRSIGSVVASIKTAFNILISPIRYVINLIDKVLSKLNIYNRARKKISSISGSISKRASGAWSTAKNWFGFGDSTKLSVDNTTKNHTIVDVNVTANGGAKVKSAARGTGGIKLRTIENGIGG